MGSIWEKVFIYLFIHSFEAMEIMELHQKIKPLEDDISILKETHEENLRGRTEART